MGKPKLAHAVGVDWLKATRKDALTMEKTQEVLHAPEVGWLERNLKNQACFEMLKEMGLMKMVSRLNEPLPSFRDLEGIKSEDYSVSEG